MSKRLIERFFHEVWNCADEVLAREVAHEILHPEFCFGGPSGEEKLGPDGFISYRQMASQYTCTIEEIVEEGQRAAARIRFAGIHRGYFIGVGPSSREISWSGAAFFAINGDKITYLWVLGDVDSVKQQLGLR